jgi:hypothetical protein
VGYCTDGLTVASRAEKEVNMPEPTSKASKSRGRDLATEAERVPVAQAEGTKRTRDRPVYAPRVDII